jgi:putative chitinase
MLIILGELNIVIMFFIFNNKLVGTMQFDLSFESFCAILPQCKQQQLWYDAIMETLPEYEIDTELRFAAFIGQMAHESNSFNTLTENLNYSRDGLLRTFSKYFNQMNVDAYTRQPQKIANKVYGNRMGNGNEASGDGFKYRGRGLVQLTGKDNYRDCSIALYGDETLLNEPDQLLHPANAVSAACWFWNMRNLSLLADEQDMVTITKKINGGTHGLEERIVIYNHCLDVLGV